MSTAEERDATVKRVQDAAAKYPSLDKVPVPEAGSLPEKGLVKVNIVNNNYVQALYELAGQGGTLIGRSKDNAMLFGKK